MKKSELHEHYNSYLDNLDKGERMKRCPYDNTILRLVEKMIPIPLFGWAGRFKRFVCPKCKRTWLETKGLAWGYSFIEE